MSTVTITDVAKRVGVSVATISRYLSGFTVRNEEKIREAIIELNYRPSAAARIQRSGPLLQAIYARQVPAVCR